MGKLAKTGTVLGTSVYVDGTLVAEDVTFSLPEIALKTQTFNAMGEIEMILPLLEAMESSITKIGLDKGLIKLLTPEKIKLEFRWAQASLENDGTQKVEGCKTFITGVPKVVFPGGDIAPGENWEGSIPIGVTRFQQYINGEEKILVDKLKGQLKINGKDYAKNINSLL